jgi:hypothetical protein
VRRLKELNPQAKVIVMTACPFGLAFKLAQAVGADGYLIKPVRVKRLVEAIRSAYRGGRAVYNDDLQRLIRLPSRGAAMPTTLPGIYRLTLESYGTDFDCEAFAASMARAARYHPAEMARLCELNPTTLPGILLKSHDQKPRQWLNVWRRREAHYLMSHRVAKRELAEQLGFKPSQSVPRWLGSLLDRQPQESCASRAPRPAVSEIGRWQPS